MRLDQGTPQNVRSRFTQAQHANLRKRTWRAAILRSSECPFVRGSIGHIDGEAIQRHQTHSRIKGARRIRRALQLDQPAGQLPKRCGPDTLSGLAKCRSSRCPLPAKTMQATKHLAVAVRSKEGHADHEPNHKPPRKSPAISRTTVRPSKHFCDGRMRHDPLQCVHTLRRRPPYPDIRVYEQHTHRSLLATWDLASPQA